MLSPFVFIGLTIFLIAFSYDIWSEWLGPRLLSRSWFPGEPDLPPVGGEGDESTVENYRRVIFAGYFTGSIFLIIGVLDALPIKPPCLPYSDVIKTYGIGILSMVTSFMWYSEGQNLVIPGHKGIRYTIGLSTIIITLYMAGCGAGVL